MKPFQLPRWRFSSCCGHEFGYDTTHEATRTGATRRDLIKSAAAGVAGLSALAALPAGSAAQGRMYPPPPPATSPVDGLIDFHVHTAPDVFGRALADDEDAASMGAKMEIAALGALYGPNAHLAFMRNSKNVSFKESADHIKAVGAQHFIISTDLGQTANPSPPDGLGWLIGGLMSQGITKEQIQTMGRENPGKLLMG